MGKERRLKFKFSFPTRFFCFCFEEVNKKKLFNEFKEKLDGILFIIFSSEIRELMEVSHDR